jgi:processing peptidase subunit beta
LKRSREQLEVEIENMGAHLNAFTSREMTIFHMQVNKSKIPQSVDILGDILQNSKYTEEAINEERGTILRELEEVNKDPMEVLLEQVYFNVYYIYNY